MGGAQCTHDIPTHQMAVSSVAAATALLPVQVTGRQVGVLRCCCLLLVA